MRNWTARQREVFICAAEGQELSVITVRLKMSRQGVEERLVAFGETVECQSAGTPLWLISPSGRPIFPFTLTPAGRAILADIKSVVLQEQMTIRKLSSFNDEEQGIVRIGAFGVHLESLLGVLVEDFSNEKELISIERTPMSPPESSKELDPILWEPLRAGQLDFVFGGDRQQEFDSYVLYSTAIVANVSPDHDWRKRGRVDVTDLLRKPIGVLPKGYFSRDRISSIMRDYGVEGLYIERPTVRGLDVLAQVRNVVPVATDDAIGAVFEIPPLPRVVVDGQPLMWDMTMHWRRGPQHAGGGSGPAAIFRKYIQENSPGYGQHWATQLRPLTG